jgi:hypothetical protein
LLFEENFSVLQLRNGMGQRVGAQRNLAIQLFWMKVTGFVRRREFRRLLLA